MINYIIYGILGISAITFLSSLYVVSEKTEAVIERFGKFLTTSKAGLHIRIPFIDWIVNRISLKTEQMQMSLETKTKDNVFVKLDVSVQLRVTDVYSANYKLTEPQEQIKSYVFDVIRASVPKLTLDETFEKKDDIALDIKKHLTETMTQYGYEIVQALVLDINPDNMVKESMNRINASQRLKEAAMNEGEANKIKVVKAAEAEADSKILQGKGIAGERKAIIEGLEQSVEAFQKGVKGISASEVMSLVVLTQYFDTLKDIGAKSNSNVILTPHSPSAVGDLQQQIVTAMKLSESVK